MAFGIETVALGIDGIEPRTEAVTSGMEAVVFMSGSSRSRPALW